MKALMTDKIKKLLLTPEGRSALRKMIATTDGKTSDWVDLDGRRLRLVKPGHKKSGAR